jgi:hypothetical protein
MGRFRSLVLRLCGSQSGIVLPCHLSGTRSALELPLVMGDESVWWDWQWVIPIIEGKREAPE